MFPRISTQFDRAPQVRRMEALTPRVKEERRLLLQDEEIYQRNQLRGRYEKVHSRFFTPYEKVQSQEQHREVNDLPVSNSHFAANQIDLAEENLALSPRRNTILRHKYHQTVVIGGDKRVLNPQNSTREVLNEAKSGRFLRRQSLKSSTNTAGLTLLPEYELPVPAEESIDDKLLWKTGALKPGKRGLAQLTQDIGGNVESLKMTATLVARSTSPPTTRPSTSNYRGGVPLSGRGSPVRQPEQQDLQKMANQRVIAGVTGHTSGQTMTTSNLSGGEASGSTGRLLSTPKGKLRPLMVQTVPESHQPKPPNQPRSQNGAESDSEPAPPSASLGRGEAGDENTGEAALSNSLVRSGSFARVSLSRRPTVETSKPSTLVKGAA